MTEHIQPLEPSLSALGTLGRCRELVRPALQESVGRLDPWIRVMAAFSFGWSDERGAPLAVGGGKALRPALAVLAAESVGAPARVAVAGAVAVELVHTFSLVHDDIMDGDEQRRHRATAWKVFGRGPATLAGDALLALALDVLARGAEEIHPTTRADAIGLLSSAMIELVNGQAADLSFESRPWLGPDAVSVEEYSEMAARKTGSLLGCACALGALFGGAEAEVVAAMSEIGGHLGTAFQAVDDVLGIWGDPEITGKPVFGDLRRRKKTLPMIAALTAAGGSAEKLADLLSAPLDVPEAEWTLRRAVSLITEAGGRSFTVSRAQFHLDEALKILDEVGVDAVATAELTALARFVVSRIH
jgi:geranylgeranyl diphosphate synthase, type I